ncbi:MAG: T9SS type A sorting domain-containing protein, partial [bacterium]|nr:T9SS type A sorting domain-containing protein [bacterium]
TFRNADSVRSDSLYYFHVPGVPYDEQVEYYFAAQDIIGNSVKLPSGGAGVSPPGTIPPGSLFSYFVREVLQGTMTIGPTGDYTNFADAFTALRTAGVADGGVTFVIADGTYDEEPLTVNGYFTANQRVLFKVDSGASVTINVDGSTASPWALRFQRTSNITFDGSWPRNTNNHLTIRGTDISNAVRFIDSAQFNTVVRCSLLVATSNSSSNRIVQIGGGTTTGLPCTGNQVSNCVVMGGYTGIYARGSTAQLVDSTLLRNNEVRDFYYSGITVGYGSGIRVLNNKIFQTQTSTGTTVTGIYMDASTQNSIINANAIQPLQSFGGSNETGIRAYGFYNTISNNMIRLGDSAVGTIYGINFADQAGTIRTIHNTISISGTAGTANSACYYNNVNSGMDTLYANIFQNLRTGGGTANYQVALSVAQIPVILFSDFNLLGIPNDSTNDNNYVARLTGMFFNTLADLQVSAWTPRDTFSFSALAPFELPDDLHISTREPTVIESGTPTHWEINTDFDGEFRTSPRCDIGADEGTFFATVDDATTTLPLEYQLAQIYPNPFNPIANIRFSLPRSERVVVNVYDATGRLVTNLVDGNQAAGYHNVQWNGSNVSSGVYFVTIHTNKYTATRKAVLLK